MDKVQNYISKIAKEKIVMEQQHQNQNTNVVNVTVAAPTKKAVKKWPSFFLCFLFGCLGAHKFYEGKTGMGILYLLTGGLFYIGAFIDAIAILFKSDPYYVD